MTKNSLAIAAFILLASCGQDASSAGDSAAAAQSSSAETELSPAEMGRRIFSQETCATCHTVDEGGANRIGPNLFGVYGRQAGQVEGFAYTNALAQSDVIWDDASLDAFLENPQGFMRGNRMAYVGQRDAEKRAAMIAYIKTLTSDAD
ncbi:cytochrome c family protein [Hyphococcus flavus]|uniref:Cytochrome c family protein n=1 Tax=Hyphococcus flavus TaxID=1866326 RepID=A0AAE9ZGT3_9PROT|nr:cytochrome c family protein [Hyphococcus flavus]WDI30576.1 cytochrome c family protein [Hyphococcus flavus]